MLLSLKTFGDNSKVDYIGWADAQAIWEIQFWYLVSMFYSVSK